MGAIALPAKTIAPMGRSYDAGPVVGGVSAGRSRG
jgi:hypothetical protein